ALLDVFQRIDAKIVHDVSGIIINLDSFVGHLTDDFGAGRAGAGFTAVLLDDKHHPVVASDGPQDLEALDPKLAIATLGMAKSDHLANAGRPACSRRLRKTSSPLGASG